MPATHVVANELPMFTVTKSGTKYPVHILKRRDEDVFVHYVGLDRRMDDWIPQTECISIIEKKKRGRPSRKSAATEAPTESQVSTALTSRGLSVAPHMANGKVGTKEIVMSEEEFDQLQHKLPDKNFEKVFFGEWEVKTWYFSPYPLTDFEMDDLDAPPSTLQSQSMKVPGVSRTAGRAHGRTLDLLMGKLEKARGNDRAVLFVCEMCFKYMTDAGTYEAHTKCCTVRHPPGRKVYQKGADTIWEVDGASHKLYCQNLALFGKLFIDHKTLYFDCENFSYYVLTDARPNSDRIMGYFSKEKISYDDYNLACIVTLPPYQKKAYGMLMIEFSYELSRRAGKVGTPERPLSDLGLRSYLAYWVATLIRFFRRVLSILPPECPHMSTVGLPDLSKHTAPEPSDHNAGSKKRKRAKGFDGEMDPNTVASPTPTNGPNAVSVDGSVDPLFTTWRVVDIIRRDDGSAEMHVSVQCTLGDLAKATNLRVEDAAFALHECGLLMRQFKDVKTRDHLLISGELVEKIAAERSVKEPCLNLNHIML
ncbi:acyl-CoA N-acyltransferase [Tricholoma matsutake]|nr:acyl-CoA N-acyltransferase [Tricholoma matsutake 945]